MLTLIQCVQTRVCMPPGSVYNWLAVAHSALAILDHALQYRAAQVGSIRVSQVRQQGARGGVYEKTKDEVKDDVEELFASTADEPHSSDPTFVRPSSLLHANEAWLRQLKIAATPRTSSFETISEPQVRGGATVASTLPQPSSTSTTILDSTAERPPATEPLILTADVNLSSSDTPASQNLSIPKSDAPHDDVLLHHSFLLCILKPVLLGVYTSP